MLWNQTYGRTDDFWVRSLVQTADGGYALAGSTISKVDGNYDYWLLKTDSFRNVQWNKTYGGTEYDIGNSVVQASDGGYLLAGGTMSYGVNGDFWLVKTNSDGQLLNGEVGLVWVDSPADTVTLHRGAQDTLWNYVRVRLWKPR
jgi:hypothetical protein